MSSKSGVCLAKDIQEMRPTRIEVEACPSPKGKSFPTSSERQLPPSIAGRLPQTSKCPVVHVHVGGTFLDQQNMAPQRNCTLFWHWATGQLGWGLPCELLFGTGQLGWGLPCEFLSGTGQLGEGVPCEF